MKRLLVVCAFAACASSAWGQTRSPAERQILADLSQVIGQAHALSQVCRDPADQYWRERMIALIETERPDPGLQQRLQSSFNAGYNEIRRAFPVCNPQARDADARIAAQGQALARRLAETID